MRLAPLSATPLPPLPPPMLPLRLEVQHLRLPVGMVPVWMRLAAVLLLVLGPALPLLQRPVLTVLMLATLASSLP